MNALELRGEITKAEYKQMRPKFAQLGRAHGLPKIQKKFFKVPSFRLNVDTTNTPHYGVSKFLTSLTQNECTVKDPFETVNC